MSEEEIIDYLKESIEHSEYNFENFGEHNYLDVSTINAISKLLDLYNKQKEEIEELKKPKFIINAETGEVTKIHNDYISKDKIRDKIKELDDLNSKFSQRVINSKERYFTEMIQNILKELLEE